MKPKIYIVIKIGCTGMCYGFMTKKGYVILVYVC